jgi:DedD protein
MARQQNTDDEDSLRRQARRRLIGAVALITAVVVILPMVLDREPKPEGQDIELRIPDKNRAGEFAPSMTPMQQGVPADSSSASQVAAVAPHTEAPPPAAVVQPQPAMQEQSPAQPDKAAAKPVAKEAAKPIVKEAAKPAAEAHAPEQVAAASSFVVQVGAFSRADTAHNLQKKLSKEGFKAYTEKAGDKLRVRVGPYATREAADKALHKLETLGLHPIVSPAQQ